MTTRARSAVIGLIVVTVSLAIALGLAEIVVRLAMPQKAHWLDFYAAHPVLPYTTKPNVDTVVTYADGSKWRVRSNADGFRVPTTTTASAAEARPPVLWIGDSFVYGLGVEYDAIFFAQLENMPGARNRAVNIGIPGYSPVQYKKALAYALDALPKPERAIVTLYLGNDFVECDPTLETPVVDGILGNKAGLMDRLLLNSHFARLVERTIRKAALWGMPALYRNMSRTAAWEPGGPLAERAQCVSREIAAMRDRAAQAGVKLEALLIPDAGMVGAARGVESLQPRDGRDFTAAHKAATRLLDELGVPYIDALPEIAKQEPAAVYLPNDVHLNRAGNAAVRDAIVAQRPDLVAH